MADSITSNSGAGQLRTTTEKKQVENAPRRHISRRKLTLITITLLLNILHWSSFICASTAIYQIASTPDDKTSLPSEILTLLSALVTISYTYLHTIISLKQRIWMHQTGHSSAIKKSSYFATRLAVSLCVSWLLTVGWDMIIVARRPICLSEAPGLQVWEFGPVCHVARLGIAFGVIALVASLALFGVLGVVRRPFEAHLYKHGYRRTANPFATPTASRGTSPTRHDPRMRADQTSGRRRSISTQRSTSDSDVETLDLSNSSPPIHAPFPQRALGGLGIFTSKFVPPPIPPEFMHYTSRAASLESLPPIFQPTASHRVLTLPPRLSGNVSLSGYVGPSLAPQYSASTLRAVHPANPSPLRPASRSQPYLPNAAIPHSARYSRSSVSLTRPRRLSNATPNGSVAWSSRSGSTGPEGRNTPAPGDEASDRRAPAKEIAFAIMNGTPIPGTTRPETRGKGHKRRASAPDAPMADDATDRKAMGWKPQLTHQPRSDETLSVPIKLHHLTRSSSAEFMSRFSPDSSPDNNDTTPCDELERNIDLRSRVMKELPFSRQTLALPIAPAGGGARSSIVEAAAAMVSKMPHDLLVPKTRVLHSEPVARRKMKFEEVKNKPLPKIAML